MRWLLTGDTFDVHQALRLGWIQEVTEPGEQLDMAIAIAKRISRQTPLGIKETMASAHRALPESEKEAGIRLRQDVVGLMEIGLAHASGRRIFTTSAIQPGTPPTASAPT